MILPSLRGVGRTAPLFVDGAGQAVPTGLSPRRPVSDRLGVRQAGGVGPGAAPGAHTPPPPALTLGLFRVNKFVQRLCEHVGIPAATVWDRHVNSECYFCGEPIRDGDNRIVHSFWNCPDWLKVESRVTLEV